MSERTFNDWYEEPVGYSLRLEHALHELGHKAEPWLRAAYDQGKADAILARPEPSEAMVEAVAQSLGDVLSSRERYYFTDPTRNRDGSLSMSFDGEVNLTELARAAIAAYDGEV